VGVSLVTVQSAAGASDGGAARAVRLARETALRLAGRLAVIDNANRQLHVWRRWTRRDPFGRAARYGHADFRQDRATSECARTPGLRYFP
jgi:hypothetical protein